MNDNFSEPKRNFCDDYFGFIDSVEIVDSAEGVRQAIVDCLQTSVKEGLPHKFIEGYA